MFNTDPEIDDTLSQRNGAWLRLFKNTQSKNISNDQEPIQSKFNLHNWVCFMRMKYQWNLKKSTTAGKRVPGSIMRNMSARDDRTNINITQILGGSPFRQKRLSFTFDGKTE